MLNIVPNVSLETQGGNPILKKKSLAKRIVIKETLHLRDIWRIKNPKLNCFIFHQNHVSGCIQKILEYFLISNSSEDNLGRAEVLASRFSGNSPVIFTLAFKSNKKRQKGLWIFNKSLLSNDDIISIFQLNL